MKCNPKLTANDTAFSRRDKDDIAVIQITDTHLFSESSGKLLGLVTDDTFHQVLREVQQNHWPADVVLATGDLVHDGSEQGYARLRAAFNEFGAPVYCLAGNHDESKQLKNWISNKNVYVCSSVCIKAWQFVFLNTTIPGEDGGRLGSDELQVLEECLRAEPDRNALVCLHHPPVTLESAWLDAMAVQNAQQFFNVIDVHRQVRGIVWGHVHQEFIGHRKGVLLMSTPSTCFQFKPESHDFAIDIIPPGYRWMVLRNNGTIDTGIRRLPTMPEGLDKETVGY